MQSVLLTELYYVEVSLFKLCIQFLCWTNETPHFPARLLSLFFVVKNRGKRIKTNQQTLEISGIFRFVFIIVYGHSFASLAYHLGIPEKTVMKIGGWSNDATMRKIYTHISQSKINEDSAKLVDFLNNETP